MFERSSVQVLIPLWASSIMDAVMHSTLSMISSSLFALRWMTLFSRSNQVIHLRIAL